MVDRERIAEVADAIERVKVAAGLSSDNRLAGALDVTKQALSIWRNRGRVPALRACQMELLSQGQVSWQELAPEIIADMEG